MKAARVVACFALISAWAIWWGPSIVFHLVRIAAARVRFAAEMAVADALIVLGRDRAARQLLARVILRNRRFIRADRARTGRARRK